jgi:hypothetical protein
MQRRLFPAGLAALCAGLLFYGLTKASAQAPAPSSSSTQNASQSQASTQAPPKDSATPANAEKPKKVWTNENLADSNGHVSVVGDPKNAAKAGTSGQRADLQYIANTRKQLEKLQSELDDTNKKLANLRDFAAGESVSYSGYQYRKGYDREPVGDQIRELEEKKKQTQAKIDALLEEARKKGVEPGQLR